MMMDAGSPKEALLDAEWSDADAVRAGVRFLEHQTTSLGMAFTAALLRLAADAVEFDLSNSRGNKND